MPSQKVDFLKKLKIVSIGPFQTPNDHILVVRNFKE